MRFQMASVALYELAVELLNICVRFATFASHCMEADGGSVCKNHLVLSDCNWVNVSVFFLSEFIWKAIKQIKSFAISFNWNIA